MLWFFSAIFIFFLMVILAIGLLSFLAHAAKQSDKQISKLIQKKQDNQQQESGSKSCTNDTQDSNENDYDFSQRFLNLNPSKNEMPVLK